MTAPTNYSPAEPSNLDTEAIAAAEFVARWESSGGSERANYQLFLIELAELLGVEKPNPAGDDSLDNSYVFERRVQFQHGDGKTSPGYIDLYRRGCFVCEAKKLKTTTKGKQGQGFNTAMLQARSQAESYARALPKSEGRPPFLMVVDVGNCIELYSEFSRSGATYVPFPDPQSHRLKLADLLQAEVRDRLRALWVDPLSLDPAIKSAAVTREIAAQLAKLAVSLEAAGNDSETVAGFLCRCLFTLFAEDVGLLGQPRAFTELLESLEATPEQFAPVVYSVWQTMDTGGLSVVLRANLPQFNGKFFRDPQVLPLDREQLRLLITAARADWRFVEPAIFGTLLERALDPKERHRLGAHYTPRAYVERLILPTVIEPLREEWETARAAALTLASQDKMAEARAQIRQFHHHLCQIRILDPACGSANFLYVTLEHLKRLEGEVLNLLSEFGDSQGLLDLQGVTVDPHQFLGIEINPRAAAIAEMVLWIGYLQWHFRTRGQVLPPQPVLREFSNIECRDAVLAYDGVEPDIDTKTGEVRTRWGGRMMRHPVTGEEVPDPSDRVVIYRYINPQPAEWPQADYVVSNPPFLGNFKMREVLGDGYATAIRSAYKKIPDTVDYVMYWWEKAANLLANKAIQKFGLITTNTISQVKQRKVIENYLEASSSIQLSFVIPDHPWVDSASGADVRIAMTVASLHEPSPKLLQVLHEVVGEDGLSTPIFKEKTGIISAALKIGSDLSKASKLAANDGLCSLGVALAGAGFIVSKFEARKLGLGEINGIENHIRHYRNGRDVAQTPRDVMVLDCFGLSESNLQQKYPVMYQWIYERVKPERDQNNRKSRRENWWLFGETRSTFRPALKGLSRFISTPETAKHRFFVFLDASILPDNMLVNFALDDAYFLGVLSSYIHVVWALASGGRLGIGNDPRYQKTRCFDTFPFPELTSEQKQKIQELGERLDAHRKRVQATQPDITITGMYNLLEKMRAGEPFTDSDRAYNDRALVSTLKQIHDELDIAVLEAYGWQDLVPSLSQRSSQERSTTFDETLLERLVALNAERALEEKQGQIRWLRPDFQNPSGSLKAGTAITGSLDLETEAPATKASQQAWPSNNITAQVQAIVALLETAGLPQSATDLDRQFKGKKKDRATAIGQILESLCVLGRAQKTEGDRYVLL
ncbi:DNA methyltransferase (plasmid) [Synechococcus elongatus PCC 11801]|uniref:DNA methyltransferase n=1 Tax=Synechococcus elongatus PCC 11801 TaxID=2219813 RepID=A0ACD5A3L6_SYNEL